jgi:hypothetical protein
MLSPADQVRADMIERALDFLNQAAAHLRAACVPGDVIHAAFEQFLENEKPNVHHEKFPLSQVAAANPHLSFDSEWKREWMSWTVFVPGRAVQGEVTSIRLPKALTANRACSSNGRR